MSMLVFWAVDLHVDTNVSEEHTAFIFGLKTGAHGVTTQNTNIDVFMTYLHTKSLMVHNFTV
jgi:hypothetical protein